MKALCRLSRNFNKRVQHGLCLDQSRGVEAVVNESVDGREQIARAGDFTARLECARKSRRRAAVSRVLGFIVCACAILGEKSASANSL